MKKTEFKQLSPKNWPQGLDLPAVTLAMEPDALSQRCGVSFFEDADDLDQYRAAIVQLLDGTCYALFRYARTPIPGTSIWIDRRSANVAEQVRKLLSVIHLEDTAVAWESQEYIKSKGQQRGSRRSVCASCGGKGTVDCNACQGRGVMKVRAASGPSSEVRCQGCGGKGETACLACGR